MKIGIVILIIATVVVVVAATIWFIALSVNLESGLVGHWDFNEGYGATLGDSSDFGNDGTIYGNAAWVDGIEGTAIYLDGINDYIDVGNDDSLNPENAITISAWFKPISFKGYGSDPIVTKGYTSHIEPYYQYHLSVVGDLYPRGRPGSFAFIVSIGGTRYGVQTPPNTWTAGNWYHIVGTFDGSNFAIYVNGVLEDTSVVTTLSMVDYGKDVYFGKFNNLIGHAQNIEAYVPGTIDEIRIYERAFTASEVESLYSLLVNNL